MTKQTKQPERIDTEIDNMIGDLIKREATPADMSNFIHHLLLQTRKQTLEEERRRLLPLIMNGYEDMDDFVSKNYQISATPAGEYDDDSIEMGELYEQLKKESDQLLNQLKEK